MEMQKTMLMLLKDYYLQVTVADDVDTVDGDIWGAYYQARILNSLLFLLLSLTQLICSNQLIESTICRPIHT
jgi:hypothetical protein